MTFKEKLQMELPNEICKGVPSACPTTYGYEKYDDRPCKGKGLIDYVFCEGCWNREMPTDKTEESLKILEAHTKAYEQGLNDAWELAKRISSKSIDALVEMFDTDNKYWIFRDFTPQEAIARLKAYEEAHIKIEVGDVVFNDREEVRGIVLDFDSADPCAWVLNENRCVEEWEMCDIKKTDKHIDLDSILEQIGE